MHRLVIFLISLFVLLSSGTLASAASGAATVEEAGWFAGSWTVGPAPVEGFETITEGPASISVIRHLEGAMIERALPIRETVNVMRFEVRSFGGNFPWWGENGGNYVSKKVDENAFLLAPVSAMGKAEWDRGWLYTRVESPAAKTAAAE